MKILYQNKNATFLYPLLPIVHLPTILYLWSYFPRTFRHLYLILGQQWYFYKFWCYASKFWNLVDFGRYTLFCLISTTYQEFKLKITDFCILSILLMAAQSAHSAYSTNSRILREWIQFIEIYAMVIVYSKILEIHIIY